MDLKSYCILYVYHCMWIVSNIYERWVSIKSRAKRKFLPVVHNQVISPLILKLKFFLWQYNKRHHIPVSFSLCCANVSNMILTFSWVSEHFDPDWTTEQQKEQFFIIPDIRERPTVKKAEGRRMLWQSFLSPSEHFSIRYVLSVCRHAGKGLRLNHTLQCVFAPARGHCVELITSSLRVRWGGVLFIMRQHKAKLLICAPSTTYLCLHLFPLFLLAVN